MATDYKEKYRNLAAASGKVMKNCPSVMRGFGQLHAEALKDGTLPTKFKELIALAIAIARNCEGCIVWHLKSAIDAGATREEVLEAIGVAIMMSGGPGTIYSGIAVEAMEDLLK